MASIERTITFRMKATPGGAERLNAALANAKVKVRELQDAVHEANSALEDLQFVVERAKPEEAVDGDQDPGS
jgi:ribosome maturation protein Sdo1